MDLGLTVLKKGGRGGMGADSAWRLRPCTPHMQTHDVVYDCQMYIIKAEE